MPMNIQCQNKKYWKSKVPLTFWSRWVWHCSSVPSPRQSWTLSWSWVYPHLSPPQPFLLHPHPSPHPLQLPLSSHPHPPQWAPQLLQSTNHATHLWFFFFRILVLMDALLHSTCSLIWGLIILIVKISNAIDLIYIWNGYKVITSGLYIFVLYYSIPC